MGQEDPPFYGVRSPFGKIGPLWPKTVNKVQWLMAILEELPKPSLTNIRLKITFVKFHLNLPGADELNSWTQI